MIPKTYILSVIFLFVVSSIHSVAQDIDSLLIEKQTLHSISIQEIPLPVNDSLKNTIEIASDTTIVIEDLEDNTPHHKYLFEEKVSNVTDKVVSTVFKPNDKLKADSIIKVFDDSPSFGIYKDNYIVAGTDLFRKPDSDNSDAKFQISVMQRLTNSVLPFRTYLFLTYTQLAFWDIFKESFPFRDINFNPAVGLGKPLVYGNRYLGDISVLLEHESNGKDSINSRSWNRISFTGFFNINTDWSFFGKVWIPFVDGENNPNLVRFKGIGTFALNYSKNEKYNLGIVVNPRPGGFGNMNVTINAAYRLFKNENQYLFFQYYDGYGEGLLDYKEYHQRFRIGFIIRPSLRFMY